jgi:hypothetical protein
METEMSDFIYRLQKKKTELELKEEKDGNDVETSFKKVYKKNPAKFTDVKQGDKMNVNPEKSDMFMPKCDTNVKGDFKFQTKCNPTPVPESKQKSKNESIFILAGIEELLTDGAKREGASRALDIIDNYMGGKADPALQQFIDMFRGSLERDDNKDNGSAKDVEHLK